MKRTCWLCGRQVSSYKPIHYIGGYKYQCKNEARCRAAIAKKPVNLGDWKDWE